MASKSIGQFILALRKANGLTQQEVADRLNVSNKAVSRWERDECAPDLSLIPALAELFGVTCDELLKGERIQYEPNKEKREARVENQLKSIINRAVSKFKIMIWISIALSAVGLICMLGISYGFYRPVVGFAVLMLFAVAAFVCTAAAVNRLKETTKGNELFDGAGESVLAEFNTVLGGGSFAAFFAAVAAVIIALPLVVFYSEYVESVLAFGTYIMIALVMLVILALIFVLLKKPYAAWIIGQPRTNSGIWGTYTRKMSCIQLWCVAAAAALFVIAPYFKKPLEYSQIASDILYAAGLALLAGNIVCFIIFLIKYRKDEKGLLLAGIRNVIMIFCGWLCGRIHIKVHYYYTERDITLATDLWHIEYLFYAAAFAAIIFLAFHVLRTVLRRREKL